MTDIMMVYAKVIGVRLGRVLALLVVGSAESLH